MAIDKKSFILYSDLIYQLEELTDEEAGKLMKHLLRYVNDMNPISDNRIVSLVFEPIKLQLKRDLEKWSDTRIEKVSAGKLGGIMSGEARRKRKEANEASASIPKQDEANEAVNVTVNVNETILSISEIVFFLNEKTGKKFNPKGDAIKKIIGARLKDYSVDDLKKVISTKTAQWKNTDMEKYLRPETLFSATKFEGYLNEAPEKVVKEIVRVEVSELFREANGL